MKLSQLEIRALPGIDKPFTLVSPGLCNVISAPNAAGKSSLIRAMRYLLSPPHKQDPAGLSLSAHLEGIGGKWTVERNGTQVTWKKPPAEEEVSPPRLPEERYFYCYLLSMEDLLSSTRGKKRWAKNCSVSSMEDTTCLL